MADTITTTRELMLDCYFVDGDTRVQTLKNPKTNLQQSAIQTLQTYMQTNNLLIGDKTGAAFGRFTKAYTRTTVKKNLDFTS